MVWINSDGLRVRFDHERLLPKAYRGEDQGAGPLRYIDVELDAKADFVDGVTFLVEGVILPRNSYLVSADYSLVAAVTGTTGLTVGVQHLDGTTYDADGILTALSALTIGTEGHIVKGGSGAGALLGTVLAYPGKLIIVPTGTGTAGTISLRIGLFVAGEDLHPSQFNP